MLWSVGIEAPVENTLLWEIIRALDLTTRRPERRPGLHLDRRVVTGVLFIFLMISFVCVDLLCLHRHVPGAWEGLKSTLDPLEGAVHKELRRSLRPWDSNPGLQEHPPLHPGGAILSKACTVRTTVRKERVC